jgi:hypothetical protein
MPTKSIHEFDDLMKELDIDTANLGCVMLPVEPFDIFGEGRDQILDVEDLYASNNPERWWVNGDVSDIAHITLLFGLITPSFQQKEVVDKVLETWDRPEYLIPERITFFPSPYEDEDYAAIVVEIEDEHLIEAHQRLSYLPHVNTYPVYRAHMTIAYVRKASAQRWMDVLNKADFHIYVKEGELDYGEKK